MAFNVGQDVCPRQPMGPDLLNGIETRRELRLQLQPQGRTSKHAHPYLDDAPIYSSFAQHARSTVASRGSLNPRAVTLGNQELNSSDQQYKHPQQSLGGNYPESTCFCRDASLEIQLCRYLLTELIPPPVLYNSTAPSSGFITWT